ncbi:MAG: AAA family ATPase, partial [Pseudonocardiaceae bacterium]
MTDPGLSADKVHLLAQGRVRRIWGPPGTGKTRTLTGLLRAAVGERGQDSAAAVSFTVTAARNLAGQDTGLPDTAVGTLHSLAYRALGHPDVVLDPKIITGWNGAAPREWWIAPDARRGRPDMVGEVGAGESGDQLLSAYDVARARLEPVDSCPAPVRRFAQAWEAWKSGVGVDFGDMIAFALERARSGERAPGSPQVLVVDEAQDLTPLECALCLAWGAHCDELIFALDDDQAINAWRGGSPAPILALESTPDVEVFDHPLPQSYRIPAAVQRVALSWVRQIGERRREKDYLPRDGAQGRVYPVRYALEDEQTALKIAEDVGAGRTVMVLATCQYMLYPMLAHLTRLGIPFGNRFRPAERAWNPLRTAKGMPVAERLFRYLVCDDTTLGGWDDEGGRARLWTGEDVAAWRELVGAKEAGLARGAKTRDLPPGELDVAQVTGLFATESDYERAASPELDWLLGAALAKYRAKLTYPAAVARRCGPAALVDE